VAIVLGTSSGFVASRPCFVSRQFSTRWVFRLDLHRLIQFTIVQNFVTSPTFQLIQSLS
jgi:hypothetical protein